MRNVVNKCLECRLKSSAASALDEMELNLLSAGCQARVIRRGETVFSENDPASSVVYIREGSIKQYKNHSGRKEQIINIAKSGSYLGLHSLITGQIKNFVSAKAIKKTTICQIGRECFSELLKLNGEFASRVISVLCEDEIFFINRLLSNQQQQLYGRLAEALLYFRYVVYNKNPFVPDLTRSEIASFIGTSRESVTRALKDFQGSGLINMEDRKIMICNESRLKELAIKG